MGNELDLGPFEEFDLWMDALFLHLSGQTALPILESQSEGDSEKLRPEDQKEPTRIVVLLLKRLSVVPLEPLETQLQNSRRLGVDDVADQLVRGLGKPPKGDPRVGQLRRFQEVLDRYEVLCMSLIGNGYVAHEQFEAVSALLTDEIRRFKASKLRRHLRHHLYSSQISYIIDRHLVGGVEMSGVREQLQLLLGRFLRLLRTLRHLQQDIRTSFQPETLTLLLGCSHLFCQRLIWLLGETHSYLGHFRRDWAESVFATSAALKLETKRVFHQGLTEFRNAPDAEASYLQAEELVGLLDHACRESFAALAKSLNPSFDEIELFPELEERHQEAIDVRDAVHALYELVRQPGEDDADSHWFKVIKEMERFQRRTLKLLFARDRQPFTRFYEDLRAASQGEREPILHQLEVFLRTLLGEVGKRSILAKFNARAVEDGAPPESLPEASVEAINW